MINQLLFIIINVDMFVQIVEKDFMKRISSYQKELEKLIVLLLLLLNN